MSLSKVVPGFHELKKKPTTNNTPSVIYVQERSGMRREVMLVAAVTAWDRAVLGGGRDMKEPPKGIAGVELSSPELSSLSSSLYRLFIASISARSALGERRAGTEGSPGG